MCAHFIVLQISLLVNLVLILCIVGEFDINIACMLMSLVLNMCFNKCGISMSLLDKFNESKEVSSKFLISFVFRNSTFGIYNLNVFGFFI